MDGMPVIKIEIQHMKQCIMAMISDRIAKLDEYVLAVVEDQCRPEAVMALVNSEAERAINEALKAEVRHYFLFGDGRESIKKAVIEKLSKEVI